MHTTDSLQGSREEQTCSEDPTTTTGEKEEASGRKEEKRPRNQTTRLVSTLIVSFHFRYVLAIPQGQIYMPDLINLLYKVS